MRYVLLISLLLLPCSSYAVDLERLEIGATFVPPHNEPVIGDAVARYKIQLDAKIRFFSRVTLEGTFREWGVQDWRTIETVGHGKEAWGNSDWSVKEWRHDFTAIAGVDLYKGLQGIVEFHERPYFLSSSTYWLFGFRYVMGGRK